MSIDFGNHSLGACVFLSYFTPIVYKIQSEDLIKLARLLRLVDWEHFLYQIPGKLFNLPKLKMNSCWHFKYLQDWMTFFVLQDKIFSSSQYHPSFPLCSLLKNSFLPGWSKMPLPSPKRMPAAQGFGRRGFAQAGRCKAPEPDPSKHWGRLPFWR